MPLPHQNLVGGSGSSQSPRHLNVSKEVANGPKKEPLDFEHNSQNADEGEEEKEDLISKQLSELQEELFESLKDDISDWIVKTLGDVDINAENFIFALDTGVILCRLTQAIEKKAREAYKEGKLTEPLPDYKLHCNKNARSGTWFARDNTTNFLCWCRAYGMIDESLFDSEDLVTHHQERQVIYCLMELARIGARFGLEPPSLISMEREIDHQASPPSTPTPPPRDIPVEVVESPRTPPTPFSSSPPPPAPSPPPTVPPSPPSKAESIPSSRSSTVSTLDSEVNRVIRKCKCQDYVNRLSEGVYDVFGKRVYIRLLKGKHLMVRVGGGWDTFENYLIHHDPVQVFEFHHNSPQGPAHSHAAQSPGFAPGAFNGYLVIRSKYKSKNFY